MPTVDFSSALHFLLNLLGLHPDNRAVPQLRSPRIWGTFSASGGAGATTISLHLARVAALSGLRTLVIECDITAPLREILGAVPPYWEEYQLGIKESNEAMPRDCAAGFALLTRKSTSDISQDSFENFLHLAQEHFDLIIIDNPLFTSYQMRKILVVENTLPSLIGVNTLTRLLTQEIVIINKFSPRLKKRASIESFVVDANIFRLPKSQDLQLAMGFGIHRKVSPRNEKAFKSIIAEMVK